MYNRMWNRWIVLQHYSPVYLDVDPVNLLDPIRLFAVVGNPGSAAYSWNIKITLIDCTRNTELQGDHLYCTVHSTPPAQLRWGVGSTTARWPGSSSP